MANNILSRFPNILLDTKHNKNNSSRVKGRFVKRTNNANEMFMVIPKGNKVFLWFTYNENNNMCVSVYENKTTTHLLSFNTSLCYGKHGTILYGTLFSVKNRSFFTCEDVHYIKGKHVYKKCFDDKFALIYNLFNVDIRQTHLPNFLVAGIPALHSSYVEANQEVKTLPYNCYSINTINLHYYQTVYTNSVHNKKVFLYVKATPRNDIYELFSHEKKYIDDAIINTYKQSVMLNSIFRNIKENKNLDLLEESDDDDDFENILHNKYIVQPGYVVMECVYIPRFKKWSPINISDKKPSSYATIVDNKRCLC